MQIWQCWARCSLSPVQTTQPRNPEPLQEKLSRDQNPLTAKTVPLFKIDLVLFLSGSSPGVEDNSWSFLWNSSCSQRIPDNLHAINFSLLWSGCLKWRFVGSVSKWGEHGRRTGWSTNIRSRRGNQIWVVQRGTMIKPCDWSCSAFCSTLLITAKGEMHKNFVPSK